jgi:hypothetical protein
MTGRQLGIDGYHAPRIKIVEQRNKFIRTKTDWLAFVVKILALPPRWASGTYAVFPVVGAWPACHRETDERMPKIVQGLTASA